MGSSRHARNRGHASGLRWLFLGQTALLLHELTALTSGYALQGTAPGHRRPLRVRTLRVPESHGQENAWPRTAGMGAVTPTARPPAFPCPADPAPGGRPSPPGVMTRQGPDPIPPTDGKASAGPTTWHGRLRHLRTPAVIQATSAGTPELGQTATGSRREPQTPADFLRDARRPTAMRAHAELRTLAIRILMHRLSYSSVAQLTGSIPQHRCRASSKEPCRVCAGASCAVEACGRVQIIQIWACLPAMPHLVYPAAASGARSRRGPCLAIHTEICAGSTALLTAASRSARAVSRSTASLSRAANAATVWSAS